MCYWQRWPHAAAIAFALLAVLFRGGLSGRLLLILAALAIAVSGGIGIFHAGVEYGSWEGLTACSTSAAIGNAQDILNDIMATPLVRCDVPRSEEHTSELQSLMRTSSAVFCLKKKTI